MNISCVRFAALVAVLGLSAAAAAAGGPSVGAPGPPAGIQGRALTPDGKPAAGAPVWLFRDSEVVAKTTADPEGAFKLPSRASVTAVAALPKGAAIAWATIYYGSDGGIYTLRARRAETVRGIVLGPDGRPVEGANVSVRVLVGDTGAGPRFTHVEALHGVGFLPGMSTRTGTDGTFKLDGIPEGGGAYVNAETAHLALLAVWNGRPYHTQAVGGGDWEPLSAGQRNAILRLAPKARITGRVTRAGIPVAGAKVVARSPVGFPADLNATTDRAGRYSLEAAPGSYALFSQAAGSLVCEAERCIVRSGDAARADFELRQGTRLVGAVPLNGLSAEQWSVHAISERKGVFAGSREIPIQVDKAGRFDVAVLPGRWQVWGNSVIGNTTGTADVRPEQAGQAVRVGMSFIARAKLCVRVCDGAGAPVPGAVVLDADQVPRHADAKGEVRVEAYPRHHELVAASPDLRMFGSAAFATGADTLAITVVPGVPVHGRVLDEAANGIAAASCRVEVESPPERPGFSPGYTFWFSAFTDTDGNYGFWLPARTRFRLTVGKRDWTWTRTAVVEVPSSGESHVSDATLEAGDRIADGTVSDPSGRPLAGVPVTAWWHWFAKGGGPYAETVAYTDAQGAFVIPGLPRGIAVVVGVRDTAEFMASPYTPPADNMSRLKIVAARRVAKSPLAFPVGQPVFSNDDVDWLQGDPPTTGAGELYALFVTAYDPDCEEIAAQINSSFLASGVVVFDSALPLEELRAHVAKLGIRGPVARVKDGPFLGWGSQGLFHRFAVPYVPSWGSVDAAGRLQRAGPDYPGGGLAPSVPHPLRYRVGTDGTAAPGAQAKPSPAQGSVPSGMTQARFYSLGTEASSRILAIGTLDGRPVVAVDARGAGDPADLLTVPLVPKAGGNLVAVVPLSKGTRRAGAVFLGHYEVAVSGMDTPNEKVRVRLLGSKVGDVEAADAKRGLELMDSCCESPYTGLAATIWFSGTADMKMHRGGRVAQGCRAPGVDVDPAESQAFARQERG